MQRRDFLRLCGAASLGFAAPVGPSIVSGAEAAKSGSPAYGGPYYVIFNAAGGWDTTYLMDPKGVNKMNRLYKEGDILTRGAHRLAPNAAHIKAGLSNEDFFKNYGGELLVLNGLDQQSANHEPGKRYMATGKLDSLVYPTFAALVAACKGSEELKIRDKLVIVIQSEMGRTPTYNKNNGKDHWAIGSIMFMGRGIRGNRVIGATDEKQLLVPVDPKTLSIDKEKGIRIRPEHIHLALRNLAGIDQHEFSKKFPLKVSEQEQLKSLWG